MSDVLIIRYNSWGNANIANRLWEAIWENSGELEDYNSKDALIEDARRNGWEYKVLRYHRNGTTSVMETNSITKK